MTDLIEKMIATNKEMNTAHDDPDLISDYAEDK